MEKQNLFSLYLLEKPHQQYYFLYHDIIYDSSSSTNEEDSASLIDYLNLSSEDKKYVKDIILFTKYKEPTINRVHKKFLKLDFGILLDKNVDISELIKHEILIRKEYLQYDLNSFVGGRYYVLQNLCKLLSDSNIEYKNYGIEKLMNYIEFIITSNTLQNSIYDI